MFPDCSLIDKYLVHHQDDDWFHGISDLVQFSQVSSSAIDTFNLYLHLHKALDVKRKVVELVKDRFHIKNGNGSKSVALDWKVLQKLNWPKLYRKQCIFAFHQLITTQVTSVCEEDFSEVLMPRLQDWLDEELLPFVVEVLGDEATFADLKAFTVRSFVEIRTRSLFEIIADFPDSLPAAKELKECIKEADCIGNVGRTLRSILQRRLLHLGASTQQILDFYIAMIKVLRILDGSDVLLHFVAEPVREYLQSRKDSIRCIISSLTETKDSDLHDELKKGTSLAYGIDEDDEEGGPGENWMPTKRVKELSEADVHSKRSRGLDILATLVSIYGSTDLFIAEYRSLLAEKMVANLSYATDLELVNVELLKIRFGEESLHHCEVMLKDVEDSKRTNAAILTKLKQQSQAASSSSTSASSSGQSGEQGGAIAAASVTDMLILSEHYWPSLQRHATASSSMKLHKQMQTALDTYCDTYHEVKKPRKLTPLVMQGTVDLTLSFDDGSSRSFVVTPLQANLIHLLGSDDSASASASASAGSGGWTRSALSEAVEVDEDEVAQAMRYWISKGVVRYGINAGTGLGSDEEAAVLLEVYRVIEEQAGRAALEVSAGYEGDLSFEEHDEADDSEARQQAAKDFAETYVRGLLRAHGAMPLDRLQTMLSMMLRAVLEQDSSSHQVTSSDLSVFLTSRAGFLGYLTSLVEKGVLDVDDGLYSEHKKV